MCFLHDFELILLPVDPGEPLSILQQESVQGLDIVTNNHQASIISRLQWGPESARTLTVVLEDRMETIKA